MPGPANVITRPPTNQPINATDKIEDLRAAVGAAGAAAGGATRRDELELMELLGEGAFGRVHRGLWRGSVVAVKTMVLPAAMRASAKRERMVRDGRWQERTVCRRGAFFVAESYRNFSL